MVLESHKHTLHFDKRPDNIYTVDLNALPASVTDFVVTDVNASETVVSFCVDGRALITCVPEDNGKVTFWDDWSWKIGSARNVSITIQSPTPPTATFVLHNTAHFQRVKIPHQKFVPQHPMFAGTDYNNALLFVDGQVTLRYT